MNAKGENKAMNDRIVSNPKVLGGKPCVRGTRIPVYMVLELVEAGISFDQIRTKYYPQLSEEDVKACVAYARKIVQNEDVHLVLEPAQ
jgi:uncharacterized protein (DUF433 family)